MTQGPVRLKIQFPEGTPLLTYDKKNLKSLMRKAGAEIAALARALIRRSVGGGRVYRGSGGSKYRPYKAGSYSASSPGQPPVSVTGTLAGSIIARPFKTGDGVAIRDTMFYALFLEKGARGGGPGRRNKRTKGSIIANGRRVLEPRPFLTEALDQRSSSLESRIKDAVLKDIEFKRQKA